jgi:ATP-dependent helicase HrpB
VGPERAARKPATLTADEGRRGPSLLSSQGVPWTAGAVPGPPLPVDAVVPEVLAALADRGCAVLRAPPGTGKTTRVPLALLDAPWLEGRRILVLEPRRVAARAAARRLASNLGEELGHRVGYRIRQERVGGRSTRIEVVTEGVLTRLLQADPALEDVGAVIFDEFHERSITADLGLALSLDARDGLRPDLRILVMSATLDVGAVAALLGDAPVISASTVAHPVAIVWVGRPSGRIDAAVARSVARALAEHAGDVLAFLPGAGEIHAVARMLHQDSAEALAAGSVDVIPLYGALPGPEQDAALRPAGPGRRKVVLATSIAETSLTIDGVRVVVDSGLMRVPRWDPSSGMTRLVTLPVSQAAAEQRLGRAARQGPGTGYRLWSATDHSGLPRATPPEILVADLAPLALDLAEWGVADPAQLRWIDPPPAGPLAAARSLLADLGALDHSHRITPHGREMARLGTHPRLGHLLLRARDVDRSGHAGAVLACEVAAILTEGDPRRGSGGGGSREAAGPGGGGARGGGGAGGVGGGGPRDADLAGRVESARRSRNPQLLDATRRSLRLLGLPAAALERARRSGAVAPEDVGRLLALAYPDRVGRARPGRPGHWLLRSGRGAWVPDTDPMAASPWIVAADLDGDRRDARIWLGAPMHADDVEELFGPDIVTVERSGWDARVGDVTASRERHLGAIMVHSTPMPVPADGRSVPALLEGIRTLGLGILPWTPELQRLRARVAFVGGIEGDDWPDLGDDALLEDLEEWLTPWLAGRTRRADLARLPLGDALWARIGWARRGALDGRAPTHVTVPTGERRRVEYPPDGTPSLAVRLQELFGLRATPTVGDGRVPVQLHLLSPAGRPVQVTSDLASFWATTYPEIRGELRARYPRHAWPEDPLTAAPTSRAAPRRR